VGEGAHGAVSSRRRYPSGLVPPAAAFSPQCSRPRVPAATPLYGVAGACSPSSVEGAGRGLRVEEGDVPQWRLPIPRREVSLFSLVLHRPVVGVTSLHT
jgi:hypothetical protein